MQNPIDDTLPPKSSSETCTDSLPLECVVKLFATLVDVEYTSPWKRKEQRCVYGSGFTVKGKLIITNARIVHRAAIVHVRRPGNAVKYKGKVVCCAPEVDLALITVSDPEFWENSTCVQFKTDLPTLDTDVTCVGYPTGGDGLSITRGVVSRVCSHFLRYFGESILMIQIDAAINAGNSGGPVFVNSDRQVIGVAICGKQAEVAQNIGYILSIPIVKMFLEQFHQYGKFLGISSIGLSFQSCENMSLRRRLGLPDEVEGGIRIKEVYPLGYAFGYIHDNDVLVKIDGRSIAQDGTISLAPDRKDERIDFNCIVTSKHPGDQCTTEIYRDGKKINLTLKLSQMQWRVPKLDNVDCQPKYLMVGGIIFVPFTYPWYQRARKQNATLPSGLYRLLDKFKQRIDQEIVVVAKVLSHDCNFGYQHLGCEMITHLNGEKINNLTHMATLVAQNKQPYLEFSLKSRDTIVLDSLEVKDAESEIMETHAIYDISLGIDTTTTDTTTNTTVRVTNTSTTVISTSATEENST